MINSGMATKTMAQDTIMCDVCEASPVQMHCNSCAANLCKLCVSDHISSDTKNDHHVVIFKKKNAKPIFPSCKTHKEQNCEMKCKQCEIPVCVKCLASGAHRTHHLTDLLEIYNSRKDAIKQETIELEKSVYPTYVKLIAELEDQINGLPQKYEKISSDVSKHGEEWHQEVDIIIKQTKQEVEKMKTDDLATLNKLLDEMKNLMSDLHQAIVDKKELLQSSDVTKVLDSKAISAEMRDPPPSIDVMPPTFTKLPVQQEKLHQMFGIVTASSIPCSQSTTELVEDKLAIAVKQQQLLDSIQCLSSIHITFQGNVLCITYLNSDQIWVSGGHGSSYIKRFTITGSLQETVILPKGNSAQGITVTRQEDLIYTDDRDRSINRVSYGKIEKIISLKQGWRPMKVCCTDSDDLLVTMDKPSTPSRVVRYSRSTEKHIIQSDDQGKPLFSSGYLFIAEHTEKDIICVSDWRANTVVVVNQTGKLLFRYTGNLSSQTYKSFYPRGVVIDSMGHILVADFNNHCIHIIDQQGHFISYIDSCQLKQPWDLTLDITNTLYVAEFSTAKVKVIKYLS